MIQLPLRTGVSGPALVRLLARLGDAVVAAPSYSLSDSLSQWLGWTDAIALSATLKGNPPAVAAGPRTPLEDEARECERVRAFLVQAIRADVSAAGRRRDNARLLRNPKPAESPTDYADFRQCYQLLQKTMESEIADLRARLRANLATRDAEKTRLAMVDAVMERVLGARERSLLSGVPKLLERHFKRLRQEAQAADDAPEAKSPAAPGAWVDAFRKDMHSVLLAELDIRLQPVQGLLCALRAS